MMSKWLPCLISQLRLGRAEHPGVTLNRIRSAFAVVNLHAVGLYDIRQCLSPGHFQRSGNERQNRRGGAGRQVEDRCRKRYCARPKGCHGRSMCSNGQFLHWNSPKVAVTQLLIKRWPSGIHRTVAENIGAPAAIRTRDLRLRRPTLYPAELRAHRGRDITRRSEAPSSYLNPGRIEADRVFLQWLWRTGVRIERVAHDAVG